MLGEFPIPGWQRVIIAWLSRRRLCHAFRFSCCSNWRAFMKAIVLWLARALCAYSVLIAMAGFCAPVQLVSVRDSAQTPPSGGAGDSWGSIVSPDGRFILFASTAYNLALTTNGHALPVVGAQKINVFLRDRTNGSTTLVSVNIKGNGGGNG